MLDHAFEDKHRPCAACSDGAMDARQLRRFGPCMVAEWGLQKWKEPILQRWSGETLRRLAPGANRFQALVLALTEIDSLHRAITGLDALAAWVENAPVLSEAALAVAADRLIDAPGRGCLEKALAWSRALDAAAERTL